MIEKNKTNNIIIKQAVSADITDIEDILLDAVNWMNANHISNLWNEENIQWISLAMSYDISDFYLAYLDNKPVGCMALTNIDHTYWPNIPEGSSFYLHKLAVKRMAAGKGVTAEFLKYICKKAELLGMQTIRLDCNANRQKLRNLYENLGFQFVQTVSNKSCKMALYVKNVSI